MTTLADLLVRAHLHRPSLADSAYHSMCKAAHRVAEAAGRLPQDLDAENIREAHAELEGKLSIGSKQYREEQTNLIRLLALPAVPADLSRRIFSGNVTLADAISAVELQPQPDKWKAVKAALTSLAERLEDGLATPVGGGRIKGLLQRLSHADFGLQPSTWTVRKSQIRKGVKLIDLHGTQKVSTSMLSGPWRELVDVVSPDRRKKGSANGRSGKSHHLAKLWPLVAFCWREGIEPTAVDDNVVQRLLCDLEDRKLKDAFESARNAVYAWELLQSEIPGWPPQKLKRVYRSAGTKSPHAISWTDLPAELRASFQEYERQFFREAPSMPVSIADLIVGTTSGSGETSVQDPLAQLLSKEAPNAQGLGSWPTKCRSRNSLPNFKTVFLFAANAAINDLGLAPKSLADVLTPAILNRVLQARYARQQLCAQAKGEACIPPLKNNTLKQTVSIFKGMAVDLGLDEAIVDNIDAYYDHVHPDVIGWRMGKDGQPRRSFRSHKMGPSHVAMLEQFDRDGGDQKLLAWFRLPGDLYARFRKRLDAVGVRGLNDEDFCDIITSIVGAVMRSCPLRRENIGELRIATCRQTNRGSNLYVPRERGRCGKIHLEPDEVKMGSREINVWLTPFATQILRLYLDKVRPEILRRRKSDPANPYLFPSYGFRHRPLGTITKHWVKRCREAGLRLDLHANRHLTAKLILDRDVTAMPLIKEILGHSSIATTEAYYAQVNEALAQRKFQEHLLEAERSVTQELLVSFRRVA